MPVSLRLTPGRLVLPVVLAVLAALVLPTTGATAQTAPPPAPTGITATRDPVDPMDFTVAWKPVDGVHHYNVSVYRNGEDYVTIVPAGTTSLRVEGVDFRTTYRITVGSRDAAGLGGTSGYVWLHHAVPGTPAALSATRDEATRSLLQVSWAVPRWPGWSPVTGYDYEVRRVSDQAVVMSGTTTDTSLSVPGVDPLRQYMVRVTAVNAQGFLTPGAFLVGNDRPGSPTQITAQRDTANPGLAHVAWTAPAYAGYSPVTSYVVSFGYLSLTATATSSGLAVDVPIPATTKAMASVQACNAQGCGQLGPVVTIPAPTENGTTSTTAQTNPQVVVSEENGTITARTEGPVGAAAQYPQLVVRVFPTADNGGFTDTQWGQNQATLLQFGVVPKGTYWLSVSGVAPAGAEVEVARKLVVVGGDGSLGAKDWELVYGRATFTDAGVTMQTLTEARVLSAPTPTSDQAFSTTATAPSGSAGYSIWFRAGLDENRKISGYALQYDPSIGNKFVVRQWHAGKECATPLLTLNFPKGFEEYEPNRVSVVAEGDGLWVGVDQLEVFRVSSLSAAVNASPCKFPPAWGTRVGFRTWSNTKATFELPTLAR